MMHRIEHLAVLSVVFIFDSRVQSSKLETLPYYSNVPVQTSTPKRPWKGLLSPAGGDILIARTTTAFNTFRLLRHSSKTRVVTRSSEKLKAKAAGGKGPEAC